MCVQGYLGQSSDEHITRTALFVVCLLVCFVFSPRKDPDVSNCGSFLFFTPPPRQIGNEEQEGHGFQSHPQKHLTQAWYRFLWHRTLAEANKLYCESRHFFKASLRVPLQSRTPP